MAQVPCKDPARTNSLGLCSPLKSINEMGSGINGLTSVGPKYNVVFVGVIPTLKEIEENALSFNVNVSHVSALKFIIVR